MSKVNNNNLLTEGEVYYVCLLGKKYIIIKDKKYRIFFDNAELGLDLTGDTIQIINIEGRPFARSLGRVTEVTIGKEIIPGEKGETKNLQ